MKLNEIIHSFYKKEKKITLDTHNLLPLCLVSPDSHPKTLWIINMMYL